MGGLSPIPAKGVDPNQFKQFKDDLESVLLWVTQETLGNAMGIKRSNINRYVKGNLPITKGFLKKFYDAWGDRITPLDKEREPSLSEVMDVLRLILNKIDHLHE